MEIFMIISAVLAIGLGVSIYRVIKLSEKVEKFNQTIQTHGVNIIHNQQQLRNVDLFAQYLFSDKVKGISKKAYEDFAEELANQQKQDK